MDLFSLISSLTPPEPVYNVRAVYAPSPQAPRVAPFNWTPVILIAAVTIVGIALMKSRKR